MTLKHSIDLRQYMLEVRALLEQLDHFQKLAAGHPVLDDLQAVIDQADRIREIMK